LSESSEELIEPFGVILQRTGSRRTGRAFGHFVTPPPPLWHDLLRLTNYRVAVATRRPRPESSAHGRNQDGRKRPPLGGESRHALPTRAATQALGLVAVAVGYAFHSARSKARRALLPDSGDLATYADIVERLLPRGASQPVSTPPAAALRQSAGAEAG
jgi:hypothetical protein